MSGVQDSGGGQGPSGQNQDKGTWFKQRRRGGNKQTGSSRQQGDSRCRYSQVPPPSPPRGEAQYKSPSYDGEGAPVPGEDRRTQSV